MSDARPDVGTPVLHLRQLGHGHLDVVQEVLAALPAGRPHGPAAEHKVLLGTFDGDGCLAAVAFHGAAGAALERG